MDFDESIREMLKRLSSRLDSPKKLDSENFITETEMETLIMSLAKSRENSEFTEEEAHTVIKWAIDTRIQSTMLDLALKGIISVNIIKGEACFKMDPEFKLPENFNEKD